MLVGDGEKGENTSNLRNLFVKSVRLWSDVLSFRFTGPYHAADS